MAVLVHGRDPGSEPTYPAELLEILRIVVVAGLSAGILVIGVVAYLAVAPWLIGPPWSRRFTVGVTAGALGGAMLIHADGVDFTSTGPLWFAVTLFVALPLAAGVALALVTDAVAAPGSWTARGRVRWVLPVLLLALVPRVLVVAPRGWRPSGCARRSSPSPCSRSSRSARTWPSSSDRPVDLSVGR